MNEDDTRTLILIAILVVTGFAALQVLKLA